MTSYFNEAIIAAIQAGSAIMEVYSTDFDVIQKSDQSPLTEADQKANMVINTYLEKTPFPIISEENKQLSYDQRKNWKKCWIVDPLDGTKEFIKRNGEFTVNIALIENGSPVFGVIYVPVTGDLYVGNVVGQSALKYSVINHQLNTNEDGESIIPAGVEGDVIRLVGSRSHMNDDTLAYVDGLKKEGKVVEVIPKGSSLKFCIVAEGDADVYPRFAPTMEWDTAAGHAICKAVGIPVIAQDTGKEMKYNKVDLLNPYFTVNHKNYGHN